MWAALVGAPDPSATRPSSNGVGGTGPVPRVSDRARVTYGGRRGREALSSARHMQEARARSRDRTWLTGHQPDDSTSVCFPPAVTFPVSPFSLTGPDPSGQDSGSVARPWLAGPRLVCPCSWRTASTWLRTGQTRVPICRGAELLRLPSPGPSSTGPGRRSCRHRVVPQKHSR